MASKKASTKSAKGGRKAAAPKKAASKKAAPKAKAASKSAKSTKSTKKAPAAKKAAPKKSSKKAAPEVEFEFKGRVAGSVDEVNTALAKSNYGRFLFVSAKNPEKTIRILDEPNAWRLYDRHWPRPGGRHACLGDNCPTCASGDQPLADVVYFRVALIDDNGKASRVMLYEPPKTVSKALIANHKRRRTLLDRDYTIERQGSGQNDTTYTVMAEDKKSRTSELKKLEKSDPLDIAAEFKRLWEEHLSILNKADDEDEDDEDVTTKDGAAAPLDDDDSDEDEDDEDDDDEDDDDDDSDDDEEDDDDADDDEEEEDDDDESDDDDEDESDDDDDDEEEEDDDEDDDDDDEEDEDDESDVSEASGTFEVKSFDTDEGTLEVVDTDSGEVYPAVYYDEDEVDLKFKKGMFVKVEMTLDDEGDWVIDTIATAKAPKGAKAAKGGKKGKK